MGQGQGKTRRVEDRVVPWIHLCCPGSVLPMPRYHLLFYRNSQGPQFLLSPEARDINLTQGLQPDSESRNAPAEFDGTHAANIVAAETSSVFSK